MSEPFSFDIDESWKAVAKLYAHLTDKDPSEMGGVGAMRSRWERAKRHLLAVLGPSGRMVLDLDADADCATLTEEDKGVAFDKARAYLDLKADPAEHPTNVSLVYSALDSLAGRVNVMELATNRLRMARRDERPGREGKGKYLEPGTKLGKYAEVVVWMTWRSSYREHVPLEDLEVVTQRVCSALSIATSYLSSRRGKVVLSVNPLEILLASMHTTGWRSCHRLNGGEYCNGPVAYMLDNCTAIAYATRSASPCDQVGGLVLPVKFWRQMVFFDLEAGSALMSREYPGGVIALARAARKAAATVLAKYRGIEEPPRWFVRHIDYDRGSHDDNDPQDAYYTYLEDADGYWHYRDPVKSRIRLNPDGKPPTVKPGVAYLICPACGAERECDDDESAELLCSSCREETLVCSVCGGDLTHEDAWYDPDGDPLCESCFHDNYAYCGHCDEAYSHEDLMRAQDRYGDYIQICERCAEYYSYYTCCHCGEYVHPGSVVLSAYDDAYCQACAEDELLRCDCCNGLYPAGEVEEVFLVVCADSSGHLAQVCQDCREERARKCAVCGESFLVDDEEEEGLLCPVCALEKKEKEVAKDVAV